MLRIFKLLASIPWKQFCWVELTVFRKKARWVDLELPPSEKTSWWRLDGYDTDATGESTSAEESDEESDDEELDEEDSNHGEEMELEE